MNMKSKTEAMRSAYVVGAAFDKAHHHADEAVRVRRIRPCRPDDPGAVKGWSTENSIDVTSDGQVHGGMGFIEETGAAQQHFRDAHHHDLRGHDRHPGQRPDRPQDRP